MNFIFSCRKIMFCHSKIKFISSFYSLSLSLYIYMYTKLLFFDANRNDLDSISQQLQKFRVSVILPKNPIGARKGQWLKGS